MTDARTKKIGLGKRLLTAAASLVMLATCAVTAMPAHAANTAPDGNLTFNFNKYLVMDENAKVPNATFTFSIAAGTAVDATASTPAIYAGNDANRVQGLPVLKVDGVVKDSVTFSASDTTYDSKQGTDTVTIGADQVYAKKVVTVDFSGVDFNAPGIYRYVITEQASSNDGISNDATNTRTLDVVVSYSNEETQTLAVTNYILYPGTKMDAVNVGVDAKDDGFTNSYTTYDLTLTKEVTGNQGDRDKYFKFTVSISGATLGTVYTVDVTTDADAQPSVDGETKTNPAELTATNGSVSADYYLKDGQSIVIEGLTAATKFAITEDDYAGDGYTTKYKLTDVSADESGRVISATAMGAADRKVTFINNKTGTVPTGILLDVAPYIVLVALVGVGLIALLATKKRRSR